MEINVYIFYITITDQMYQNVHVGVFYIYCMISPNVSKMLVSGAPVRPMLFLLLKCYLCTATYTIKNMGPRVLLCHLIINLYDISGNSWGRFGLKPLFLLGESLTLYPLKTSPSIPTVVCISECCQMDVLIYSCGILTDLVVADLNPDRPPSFLKTPPELETSS